MTAYPASLSRELQSDASVPALLHSLHELRSSVLSLAANEDHIFSGSQSQDISVNPYLRGFLGMYIYVLRLGMG